MLLALASAGRSSDLRALDIRYMSINENSISFELGQLTKSRRKGQSPIKLNFDRFDSDPLVCVVSTISYYLDRSKTWRAFELYQTTHRSSPLHNCGVACGISETIRD